MVEHRNAVRAGRAGGQGGFLAWAWGLATGVAGLAFVLGIVFWGGFNTRRD